MSYPGQIIIIIIIKNTNANLTIIRYLAFDRLGMKKNNENELLILFSLNILSTYSLFSGNELSEEVSTSFKKWEGS